MVWARIIQAEGMMTCGLVIVQSFRILQIYSVRQKLTCFELKYDKLALLLHGRDLCH